MELVYLLGSIITTFLTSLTLSLLFPFRLLLRRRTHSNSVSLYEGTVWHERRRPVHHSFGYSVRYALIDLDGACNSPPNHLSADEARRIASTTGPVYFSIFSFRLLALKLIFIYMYVISNVECVLGETGFFWQFQKVLGMSKIHWVCIIAMI